MKYIELLEGATPKLPGAGRGIKVMTPQQFVANTIEEPDQDIAESLDTNLNPDNIAALIRSESSYGDGQDGDILMHAATHFVRNLKYDKQKALNLIYKTPLGDQIVQVYHELRRRGVTEAPVQWHNTETGVRDAAQTDHTIDEALEYLKTNYPIVKMYNVRRAEMGSRAVDHPKYFDTGDFADINKNIIRKSAAHMSGVDSAVDYLQLRKNTMMSGSKQISATIGYSWSVYENPDSGIAILYYQDRGMAWDEIYLAGKTSKVQIQARQVFRDAGVLPTSMKKPNQQGVAEGIFDFKKQPMPKHGDELKIGDRYVIFDDGGSYYGVSWIKQDKSEAYEEFDKSEYTDLNQLKKAIWDEIKDQDQQGVEEGFPHDVDHMPGPRIKNPQTGCKRCHGKGYVYKTADGKVLPSNEQGAKRYKCGACGGIGFVKQGMAEGAEQKMSVQNTLAYLKKVMGTESHEDWRNHIINTNEYFVLKDIPVNSLRSDLSGLDKANVEKYKQMDFSKAPPIVIGSDGNILDGYHRVNVAKALKVPTLKAWVGVKKQGMAEGHADQQRKIFKKNGKPVGEVGIDRESSPGVGQWYMKCYSYNIDNSGYNSYEEAVAELKDCLKQGVSEATKLPVQARELKGQELEDYLERIRTQSKGKTDKYKLPYIHRSSVVKYYNSEGKRYDTDAIKNALKERPKKLLKQNEKMKHSNGESEQFFNIGFAALVGIALDEQSNELIVVNTCPGAGSCKVDCFAMKGGKIQFEGPWLSDGRILTYLLNDPDGFFNQLDREIKKEETKGDKGGYTVTIRWHDAGDFFSPEYADMAFKLARSNPDVMFYAYTKVADVALADKPANFMINWSEGAHTSQEKKVKAKDPELETTKNSRIVPSSLFYDLLVKDEKKNLVKGPEGQWQVIPEKLSELKQRLAKEYGLSVNSILSYNEWEQKGRKIPNMKWNVIITPGEPDLTAKDPGVLSTLLLKH